MIPGAMQFTRIPSDASSSAAVLHNPSKAVLLIEYTPKSWKKSREGEREKDGKIKIL